MTDVPYAFFQHEICAELDLTMALSGTRTIADITAGALARV